MNTSAKALDLPGGTTHGLALEVVQVEALTTLGWSSGARGESAAARHAWWAAAATTNSVSGAVASVGSEVCSSSGVDVAVSGGVDADGDPSKETIGDVVAEVNELREGVVVVVGFVGSPHVVVVGDDLLGVGVVWVGGLDGGAQRLVEEELTDVRDGAAGVGAVALQSRVLVNDGVDVGRATFVVAGEDGVELGNTVVVGGLEATQEGAVQAALASSVDARVDAGAVAVPDVEEHVGDGLAGVDVDELHLQVQGDTKLVLGDVLLDELAGNEVWADGVLWREDAAGVAAEEHGGILAVNGAGHVVVDGLELLEGSEITAGDEGSYGKFS